MSDGEIVFPIGEMSEFLASQAVLNLRMMEFLMKVATGDNPNIVDLKPVFEQYQHSETTFKALAISIQSMRLS